MCMVPVREQGYDNFLAVSKSAEHLDSVSGKEFFRTCNVLPFSFEEKDPRYMQNKKDSRICLVSGALQDTEYCMKRAKITAKHSRQIELEQQSDNDLTLNITKNKLLN